jgi:uncharacterized protein
VTPGRVAILAVAASVSGAINSVAGGGSLVSFPTLVWAGYDPIIANATNAVSLWPGSLAALVGFGRWLRGTRSWMVALGVSSVVGSAIGAVLLLRTPSRVFAVIVPYLIFGATALLALQGPITSRLAGRGTRAPSEDGRRPSFQFWAGVGLFQLGVAIYGGYFGAGMGILMLAGFGILGLTDIHQMIALRNFASVCVNAVAALYFAERGAVSWPAALVMTGGQVAGGYVGGMLARRLGATVIHRTVVVVGIVMGLSLLLRG